VSPRFFYFKIRGCGELSRVFGEKSNKFASYFEQGKTFEWKYSLLILPTHLCKRQEDSDRLLLCLLLLTL
jgi:hypothetical protein